MADNNTIYTAEAGKQAIRVHSPAATLVSLGNKNDTFAVVDVAGEEKLVQAVYVLGILDGIYSITVVDGATHDLVTADGILHVTYTTTDAVTITLKSDQAVSERVITIKDAGGNANTKNITIDTEGSEKIDGIDTAVIDSDYGSIRIYCDGTNWFIF